MHYDLTPEQLAEYHHRFVTELGVSASAGAAGPPPPTWPRWSRRAPAHPGSPAPGARAGAASIYIAVPFHQDTSFLVVGERTNANGSKRSARPCSTPTGTPAWPWPATRCGGPHLIDVCVDYTGPTGWPT